MQAILTRYKCETNTLDARIVVTALAGRKVYSWDDRMDVNENHDTAAATFANSLGWLEGYDLHGGGLPDSTGNAYVLVKRSTK